MATFIETTKRVLLEFTILYFDCCVMGNFDFMVKTSLSVFPGVIRNSCESYLNELIGTIMDFQAA